MRPVRVPIPATGTDPTVVPLDWYQVGNVTLAVVDVNGVVDVDLQYTLDDVFATDFDQATANWHELVAAIAADAAHNLADSNGTPIRATAVRALNGGAGDAVLQIVQSGVMG